MFLTSVINNRFTVGTGWVHICPPSNHLQTPESVLLQSVPEYLYYFAIGSLFHNFWQETRDHEEFLWRQPRFLGLVCRLGCDRLFEHLRQQVDTPCLVLSDKLHWEFLYKLITIHCKNTCNTEYMFSYQNHALFLYFPSKHYKLESYKIMLHIVYYNYQIWSKSIIILLCV